MASGSNIDRGGAMSWPYSPNQCPNCVFFQRLEKPAYDDVGYESVGICTHPWIATDLFLFMRRDQNTMEPCGYFRKPWQRRSDSVGSRPSDDSQLPRGPAKR
jgi:hypothetical protein